jgi:hypothetical protein
MAGIGSMLIKENGTSRKFKSSEHFEDFKTVSRSLR